MKTTSSERRVRLADVSHITRADRTHRALLVLLTIAWLATPITASALPDSPEAAGGQHDAVATETANPTVLDDAAQHVPRRTFVNESDKWEAFSLQVRNALGSEHSGLQEGALRQIIQYGEELSLGRAEAMAVLGIYRNAEDHNVRRMAVVAIAAMGDSWALAQLERSLAYENTERVKHTMQSVLQESHAPVIPRESGGQMATYQ